jgi:transcription-repair coupling factor (superfamily II helicase)
VGKVKKMNEDIKTIQDFVTRETKRQDLQEKVFLLINKINQLEAENSRLKRIIDELMDGRC